MYSLARHIRNQEEAFELKVAKRAKKTDLAASGLNPSSLRVLSELLFKSS